MRRLRGQPQEGQLELGGKGANIVFDDADLAAAVNGSAFAIFHNQGQACIAGSRLLLHEKIADEFLDRSSTLARSIRLGDPLAAHRDGAADLEAASASACSTIARRAGRGRRDPDGRSAGRSGAANRLLRRADRRAAPTARPRLPRGGVRPVRHGLDLQERTEALAIANGTEYGLAAACGPATCSAPIASPSR